MPRRNAPAPWGRDTVEGNSGVARGSLAVAQGVGPEGGPCQGGTHRPRGDATRLKGTAVWCAAVWRWPRASGRRGTVPTRNAPAPWGRDTVEGTAVRRAAAQGVEPE